MQCAPHITLIFSLHDRANPQDTIGSTRRCAERAKLHLEGLVQDMWQERETRDSEYSELLHEARGLCCALVRVLKRSRGWRREQAVAWRASEPKDATTSWLWIIHGHTASVHAVDLPSTWARALHVCKNREHSCRMFVALHEPRKRTVSSDNICHFCRSRKQRRQLSI